MVTNPEFDYVRPIDRLEREMHDRLAAKDAEIARLRRDLDLAAQHAAAADSECERRIAAHQAAEAEVARLESALRGCQQLRLAAIDANAAAIATERERCARVADEMARGAYTERAAENAQHIADAIRGG